MGNSAPEAVPDKVVVAAWPFEVVVGDVPTNLERALTGLEAAAGAGARLLLLPEKWTTSFSAETDDEMLAASGQALAAMHRRAATLGVIVVGSAAERFPHGAAGREQDAERRPGNVLHLVGAAGELRPYAKRMLFSTMGEGRQCRRGEGLPKVLQTAVGRLSGVICYDLRFPEVTRAAFYGEVDLLLVPAEWPRPRDVVLELLTRARAAENQCWALSCNRAGSLEHGGLHVSFPGVALLADPTGAIVERSEDGALLVGEVDYRSMRALRRQIPCGRDLRVAGLWPAGEGEGSWPRGVPQG